MKAAAALENGATNWLKANHQPLSAKYRERLEECRQLPRVQPAGGVLRGCRQERNPHRHPRDRLGKVNPTQLPIFIIQYLHLKNMDTGIVACTQPRRLAAEGVATHVAEARDVKSCKGFNDIVMSGTMEVEKFKAHFPDAGVLTLAGRMFPVSLSYITEAAPDFLCISLMVAIDISTRTNTHLNALHAFMRTQQEGGINLDQ